MYIVPNKLKSWVEVPSNSDFPIQNIPFGVFKTESNPSPRICSAIGNYVIDLAILSDMSLFDDLDISPEIFRTDSLNPLMALGKAKNSAFRKRIVELLSESNVQQKEQSWHFLHPMEKVEMLLPVKIGDYTDFYSSMEHARNVGTMFRDPDNALLPNWKHIPVGYHGRASSIIVSGQDIHRPCGQTMPLDADAPVYGPTARLDFELEMAFVIGQSTGLGDTVSTEQAEDYIFGLSLFNDWSARDIQKWEYVPLGPFLGKSFASTMAPWIITLDALEPFRVAGPVQDPPVLPYLEYPGDKNYDISLNVEIETESGDKKSVCASNFKYMYWNMAQQLAHHTVNGCNINVGDVCASGTISGPEPGSFGSMLEIAWKGTKPVQMPDGTERKFIHDGDTVRMTGHCEKDGLRIGFGEAAAKVLPVKK
ncbi:MAG: fumarylacetoacetase [Saprospiraceae bacterium]|nr:fumarylacetoacetase [Saprospiraceae bacterium]